MSARRILAAAVALAMVTAGSVSRSSVKAPPNWPRDSSPMCSAWRLALSPKRVDRAQDISETPYTLFLQFRSVFA